MAAEQVPQAADSITFDPGTTAFARSSRKVRQSWAAFLAKRAGEALALAEEAVASNPADRSARMIAAELGILKAGTQSRTR